jgi:surface antigen
VQNAERSDVPQPGAIMVLDAWRGNPYGHVAYVEQVESDRVWRITHANMTIGDPAGELGEVPVYTAICERSANGIRFRGFRPEFRLRGFLHPSHHS